MANPLQPEALFAQMQVHLKRHDRLVRAEYTLKIVKSVAAITKSVLSLSGLQIPPQMQDKLNEMEGSIDQHVELLQKHQLSEFFKALDMSSKAVSSTLEFMRSRGYTPQPIETTTYESAPDQGDDLYM